MPMWSYRNSPIRICQRGRSPSTCGSTNSIGRTMMRAIAEQALALDQRLAHQAKFEMLEIAQSAMNQLGAGGGGCRGEIVLFDEHHLEAAADGIARDADAIDATADDEQIDVFSRRRGVRWLHSRGVRSLLVMLVIVGTAALSASHARAGLERTKEKGGLRRP